MSRKEFKVKLESVDPTGVTINEGNIEMLVIDDKESMRKERLFIHIGDYLYRVDNNGRILDRIVPREHINNNSLDIQYQNLLRDILENGIEKKDRTGTGTISVFGRQIRHKMSEGFPLLTTKKMAWKSLVTELLWFLRGNTNIKFLVDNGCHIWDGDAYKFYEKEFDKENPPFSSPYPIKLSKEEFVEKIKTDKMFAERFGNLGPIYGAQWRGWRVGEGVETTLKTEDGQTLYESGSVYIDQIKNLINDLRTNPDSRRLMVNAWNVADLPITDYRTDDELYKDYLKDFE